MAEALKTFFSPALVRRLAADVARVYPEFQSRTFIRKAARGLDNLELLDRGRHIMLTLAEFLPAEYPEAIKILLASLGPEHPTEELLGVGMAPFYYLPHVLFVGERGLEHFDISMEAQVELTKRFSAESSIRAYIAHDPERTFTYFRRWVRDPNAHVRRLVSEGTRLRLPWAARVAWLDENPERVVELLDLLKDDPATLVRRSVANNLNDLGKVHAGLFAKTCAAWMVQASPERRALLEHALRSAIKRGDPAALKILGYGAHPAVKIEDVRIKPKRVSIGGSVEVSFVVRNCARASQEVLVDVGVFFVKANGGTSRKVFKGRRLALSAQEGAEFRTRVSLAVHTTRKPYPGKHVVEVLVNGVAFPAGAFLVQAPKA